MGLLGRLFGRKEQPIASSLDLFREIYGGRTSHAGETVSVNTALEVPTVLAVQRVLSNGVAQVPWRLYRDDGNGRSIAREHPLNAIISTRPNAWQTSYEFRETVMLHVGLTFNAIIFVNRVGSKREVRELIPIEPARCEIRRTSNDDIAAPLEYVVRAPSGRQRVFGADAIWHLRGPSWNGWQGMDAIRLARNAIGLGIALERGQSEFQKNGAKTSGLYSVEGRLSPEKYNELRAWFAEEFTKTGAYRPLILDQGAKYMPFTMNGVDQQLIETRKHQIEEICRAYGVMPIMVGHYDKASTYASAEQMFLAHVVHTLAPWYQRIEQSADVNLLTEEERRAGYYTKFTPNALMRGAAKDRGEFYAKALGSGGSAAWLTPNEVRAFEDMDRIEGGDELAKPITNYAAPDSTKEPDDEA